MTGCKKEQVQVVPVLTAVQEGNEIILKWTPNNVEGFKYYRIMRASDGQRYHTINNVDNPDSDAFDKSTTTYTDSNFPFSDSLHYKIMVFGNEIISSAKVCIRVTPAITLNNTIGNAYVIEEEKKILLLESHGSQSYIYLYNHINNNLLNKIQLNMNSSGSLVFFGKYNNSHEFYFYESWNNKIYIYDALTMNQVANMSFNASYTKFYPGNNGNVYANNGYNYTYVINRKNLTSKAYQGNNYINRLFYMKPNNKLLGWNSGKLVLFTLDDFGNILSESIKPVNYSAEPIEIGNSDLLYCGDPGRKKVVNTNTWEEREFIFPDNLYREFQGLHLANKIIYAYKSNDYRIYCFSIADFKLKKIINIRFEPYKLLSDSEYLYFYGNYNMPRILDKIKLIQ